MDVFDTINKLTSDVDWVLLDVMMPKLDGFSVYKEIRKDNNMSVIMVNARKEDFEKMRRLYV